MKARKRTERVRILFACLLVCSLLAGLFYGGWIFLFKSDGEEGEKQAGPISVAENKGADTGKDANKDKSASSNLTRLKRKNIYDRNLKELALSFLLASVYVKPLEIKKEEGAVAQLSELLGLNEEEVLLSISSERGFVWLARNIDRDMVEKIKGLDASGVYLVQEGVRYYPQGSLAAHIIGFAEGEQGLAGVESYYGNILSGKVEPEAINVLAAGITPKDISQGGASLILTLDLNIQDYLDDKLSALISRYNARSAMAMIIQSKTGEILALSHHPSYDSNLFWKSDSFERRNRMLTDPFPLGAFVRIVQMAAEMEQGNVPDYISEPEEIAQRIIEPKLHKKVVSATLLKDLNPIWNELDPGVFWPVVDKDFTFKLSRDGLGEFAASIGLSGKSTVDLPMDGLSESETLKNKEFDLTDPHSAATGLQTLIAFNRLVAGKKVVPHVLKDVWLEDDDRLTASFEEGGREEKYDSNRNFIRLVHKLSAAPQKNEVLFETIIEQKDDDGEQGLEFESSNVSPEVLDEARESAKNRRFQNMVLGAIPSINPELAMIVVVDGMLVDLSESSQMQSTASQLLRKSLKIYLTKNVGDLGEHRLQEKELFKKWSMLQRAQDISHAANKKKAQEMPDVLNLSFRKALQVLQRYNLRIRAEGSGMVKVQHPAPGTKLKEIGECVLELRVDN